MSALATYQKDVADSVAKKMRDADPEWTETLWAEIERMLLDKSPAAGDALEDMSLMDIIKVAAEKYAKTCT